MRKRANLVRLGYAYTTFRKKDKHFKRIRLAVHTFSGPKAKYHMMMNLKIRCFKLIRWRTSFSPVCYAYGSLSLKTLREVFSAPTGNASHKRQSGEPLNSYLHCSLGNQYKRKLSPALRNKRAKHMQ